MESTSLPILSSPFSWMIIIILRTQLSQPMLVGDCRQLLLLLLFAVTAFSKKPNFVFILVDDLGFANVNFNRDVPSDEVRTPNMDRLATEEGLRLMRHYVHYSCSPTRSSFQSGRLPVYVQTYNHDPISPNAGIPRNMTGIGTKMKSAGYQTHFIGKWDVGMATFDHTPLGRGYDSSLVYFEHANDFYTQIQIESPCFDYDPGIVDLWKDNEPAYGLNGTKYEEYLFAEHLYDAINGFKDTVDEEPFFMVYAPQFGHWNIYLWYVLSAPHHPLQVPKDVLAEYDFDDDINFCYAKTQYVYPDLDAPKVVDYKCRSMYQAMMGLLDEIIGNITDLLKENNLWDDTLLVVTSDNGGSLLVHNTASNNYPLRGGKTTVWEGGIRVATFVSGGYLPDSRRGESEYGMIHIADWYTTFLEMIGEDPSDQKAAEYGLPPVDGVNVWPLISGQNKTSPRIRIPINDEVLIEGDYKLIIGTTVSEASWTGEIYPNTSSIANSVTSVVVDCSDGCLFNVVDDWTEHENVVDEYPEIMDRMNMTLNQIKGTFYSNDEIGSDSCPENITVKCACWVAVHVWNGFFGPFQYLHESLNSDNSLSVKLEAFNAESTRHWLDNVDLDLSRIRSIVLWIFIAMLITSAAMHCVLQSSCWSKKNIIKFDEGTH